MLPCELDDDDERHHITFKLFSSVDHNGSLQLEPVQSLHTHKVTNLYRRLGQGSAPCPGQVSKPSLTVLKAQERNLDVRRKTAHSLAPNLHLMKSVDVESAQGRCAIATVLYIGNV
jgi:hypothetical protein